MADHLNVFGAAAGPYVPEAQTKEAPSLVGTAGRKRHFWWERLGGTEDINRTPPKGTRGPLVLFFAKLFLKRTGIKLPGFEFAA